MTRMMDKCVMAILDCEDVLPMRLRAAQNIVRAVIEVIREPPENILAAADEQAPNALAWYHAVLDEIVK